MNFEVMDGALAVGGTPIPTEELLSLFLERGDYRQLASCGRYAIQCGPDRFALTISDQDGSVSYFRNHSFLQDLWPPKWSGPVSSPFHSLRRVGESTALFKHRSKNKIIRNYSFRDYLAEGLFGFDAERTLLNLHSDQPALAELLGRAWFCPHGASPGEPVKFLSLDSATEWEFKLDVPAGVLETTIKGYGHHEKESFQIPLERDLGLRSAQAFTRKDDRATSFLDQLEQSSNVSWKNKKIEQIVKTIVNTPEHNYAFNPEWFRDSLVTIYGVTVLEAIARQAVYDPATSSYRWFDEEGKLNSPAEESPSIIFPNGRCFYHVNGNLHRESGPAIVDLYVNEPPQYFLHGRAVTREEWRRYDPTTRRIEFRDNSGNYHRADGPAVIEFHSNGRTTEHHYSYGWKTFIFEERTMPPTEYVAPKRKVAKVRKIDTSDALNTIPYSKEIYTELSKEEFDALQSVFKDNLPYLRKYEKEIHAAAEKILEKRGLKAVPPSMTPVDSDKELDPAPGKAAMDYKMTAVDDTKKEEMVEETRTIIRSAPDLTGTRFSQVKNGFTFGFKKQVIQNSSHLLAEKLIDLTPMEGNQWMERFLQICFLLGSAELIERMPDGLAEKIRLGEDTRLNLGSLFRYVSGEAIGRDAVDVIANVLPLIVEILKGVTTEDSSDVASEIEAQEAAAAEQTETEAQVFEPVQELHYEEAVAR